MADPLLVFFSWVLTALATICAVVGGVNAWLSVNALWLLQVLSFSVAILSGVAGTAGHCYTLYKKIQRDRAQKRLEGKQ